MLLLLHIIAAVSSAFIIWHLLRLWWTPYILRSAYDPQSPFSHLPLPPGDFGLPFVGETISWITQSATFNSSRRKKYGNIFKTNVIGLPMIRVTGHEFVNEILKGEHDTVTTIWPKNVRSLLGENVVANSLGAIHRLKRKIVFKAFTRTALESYIPQIRKQIRESIQSWSGCETPKMYDKLLRMTFDVAAATLLGFDSSKPTNETLVKNFFNLVNNIMSLPIAMPGFGFWKGMRARAELLRLLPDHIAQVKKHLLDHLENDEESQERKLKTAFEIILRELLLHNMRYDKQHSSKSNNNNNVENGITRQDNAVGKIDDLTLKEMAMELIFTGYFTTASTLTSCMIHLARNPQVFKKVERELLEHGILRLENCTEKEEVTPDLHSIHNLQYMNQVLKETLRISPPVLGGYRKAKKTFHIGGYRVPKGWTVIYNIRDTHEFEFGDMNNFDPDRFNPNSRDGEKMGFIPFGGGPRMCLGQEFAKLSFKLSLIELFRHYTKWELVDKDMPKMRAIPTLHPVNHLPCKLFPREKVGFVSNR